VETDILGRPYERRVIDLGHDDEGPVVATLVRRRAPVPTSRAVLWVHGWSDYFFQTHVADYFVDQGFDFYALDLRKYGRSLLPHQTPTYCRSLAEYVPELDEAPRQRRWRPTAPTR
jgi:alpha-beta hydrolase superfamily lysophospholipase